MLSIIRENLLLLHVLDPLLVQFGWTFAGE